MKKPSNKPREIWAVYESDILRFVDEHKLKAIDHLCKYGDLAEPELVRFAEVKKRKPDKGGKR